MTTESRGRREMLPLSQKSPSLGPKLLQSPNLVNKVRTELDSIDLNALFEIVWSNKLLKIRVADKGETDLYNHKILLRPPIEITLNVAHSLDFVN